MDFENQLTIKAKAENKTYIPQLLSNGDSIKQLLARSIYLLYKSSDKWTDSQKERG
jgi:transposase